MPSASSNADWYERFASTRYRFMRVSRKTGEETEAIRCLKGGKITRNDDTTIKESAEASLVDSYSFGPDFVRVYMTVATVGGKSLEAVLGTFLPVVPSRSITGAKSEYSLKMYGRLQELVDDKFSRPYQLASGTNAVSAAKKICEDAGLTVIADPSDYCITNPRAYGIGAAQANSDTNDTKIGAVNDLLSLANFRAAYTDPMGRVVLEKYRQPADIAPSWDFVEGPTARFETSMTEEYDYTSVANHVVVRYEGNSTSDDTAEVIVSEAWDTDPMSELSTVTRGRTITTAYTYSELPAGSTAAERQANADARATSLLATAQSTIRRVKLTSVYAPIGINETVNLQYRTGGLSGKYQVRTQTLTLTGGCPTEMELRRFVRSGE